MTASSFSGAYSGLLRGRWFPILTLVCAPTFAQSTLSVKGTLVIDTGGSNTSTVRYTGAAVIPGSDSEVVRLSTGYPTLVIRGPEGFAGICDAPADCWDSTVCAKEGGARGVCGWSGLEVPQQCAGVEQANAALDECAVMLARAKNNPTAFDGVRTDRCIAAAKSIATLTSACPLEQYRIGYDKIVHDVLAFSESQLQSASSQLTEAELKPHLKRIADWYDAYRVLYPASNGEPANEKVWVQTGRAVGDFWKAVYQKAGIPLPGSQNPSDALLDGLFLKGIEADRTVILAALTPPAPIRTAPLIQLLGDGFHSMAGRLEQVGQYHDVGCRFREGAGCEDGGVRTEVSELVSLLAASADPSELSSVLARTAPTPASPNWAKWRAVFGKLASSEPASTAVFQAAVMDALPALTADAGYSPDLLAPPALVPDGGAPAPVQVTLPMASLAEIIQRARARANSYQLSGLFDSRNQGVLRAGIHRDRLSGVANSVEAEANTIKSNLASYRAARLQLANEVLQQVGNDGGQQRVTDQILQRAAQEQQLRQDIAGLRNTIEVEEARFADFMSAFDQAASLVASNPGTAIDHYTDRLSVAPTSARWPSNGLVPPNPTDALGPTATGNALVVLRSDGASPWLVAANKGDILNIQVQGSWAPSCALAATRFVNPVTGGSTSFVLPTPALTGPEGYLFNVTDGIFSAASNGSVHSVDGYRQKATTGSSCIGGGGSLGVSYVVSLSDIVHFSGQNCNAFDNGTRTSDVVSSGTSSGVESRMSAAFASGIRAEGTPFPTFPTGSLLLLQVKRGGISRSDIREVRVLQSPLNTVVVSDDSDVYLAVNDRDCGAATDGSALSVTLDRLRPFGSISGALGQAMAKALTDLREQEAALLQQGRVGPQQMASLRDQAYVDLLAACGNACAGAANYNYYPAAVLKVFESWLSSELAIIEAKTAARATERELELLVLADAALAHDLANLKDSARLLTLVSTWVLKDLDTHMLQSTTQHLMDTLMADLYPIIDIRQPGTLKTLDPLLLKILLGSAPYIPQGQVTGYVLDWTGNLHDWTGALANASNNIVARLRDQLRDTLFNDRIVAVGIPNPYDVPIGGRGNWQAVSWTQALTVWDAINAGEKSVTISLGPTDLYRSVAGATDVLPCSDAEPVITAMMLYMVRSSTGDPYSGLTVDFAVDRTLPFATVGGEKFYRIENDDWRFQALGIAAGNSTDMLQAVKAYMADMATPVYRVANGLSPFTDFDISIANLVSAPDGNPPAATATELVLVFRVQSRNVASVRLPPVCP